MRRVLLYIVVAAIGNLAWETAQLPLYTIWSSGTASEIAFAVVHCTAGDALVSVGTLVLAVVIARLRRWHLFDARTFMTAVALGVAYTVFSEWLNVMVRRSWTYSPAMPVLPWLGTGLSPVLQWLVVPGIAATLAFGWKRS